MVRQWGYISLLLLLAVAFTVDAVSPPVKDERRGQGSLGEIRENEGPLRPYTIAPPAARVGMLVDVDNTLQQEIDSLPPMRLPVIGPPGYLQGIAVLGDRLVGPPSSVPENMEKEAILSEFIGPPGAVPEQLLPVGPPAPPAPRGPPFQSFASFAGPRSRVGPPAPPALKPTGPQPPGRG